ncbi:MAG TPA: hypothetical protein VML50_16105 [Anaeromyxobacter sp.]|nr:hypothetical protein [Anaeromyxobacter sp.]
MFLAIALSASAAALALGWTRMIRRDRRLTAEVGTLSERVRELAARVEAAEADVAHAVTQTEITESLLLDKGVADEEDIEAARRRFDGGDPPPAQPHYIPGRDGDLH